MDDIQNQVVNNEQPTAQQNVVDQPQNDNFGERLNKAFKQYHTLFGIPDDIAYNKDRNVMKKWYQDYIAKATENSKKVDELNGNIANLQGENYNLRKELAFLKNNIEPSKQEDILTYFKGLNKEFNEEELINLLATHPEWVRQQPQVDVQIGQTKQVEIPPIETPEEKKRRIFGL